MCAAIMAACTQGMKADDYNYLTVAYNNIEQSITLSTVQKITFSTTEVIVTTTGGNVTFPLVCLSKGRWGVCGSNWMLGTVRLCIWRIKGAAATKSDNVVENVVEGSAIAKPGFGIAEKGGK